MHQKIASLLALLAFIFTSSAFATNHVVTLSNFSFSPSTLTINVGDTVTFSNPGKGFHNAHADNGSFECAVDCNANGSPSSTAWSSTVTFSAPGTVTYHCDIHQSMGMTGSITVQGAAPVADFSLSAQAPSLSIAQGGSATDTLTVTPQNGFTGNVAFAVSNLPGGVTAAFSNVTNLVLTASAGATVGTAPITITGTSGSLTHSITVSLTVAATAPPPPTFSIQAGTTGIWYDPAQSGHGFDVEVLDATTLVAIWYVFDANGNNFWLVGTGSYSGSTATLDVSTATGGFFPPNFDQTKVTRPHWGSFTFTFSDCNNGHVAWTPDAGLAGFTAGSLDIARLTLPGGLTCQ